MSKSKKISIAQLAFLVLIALIIMFVILIRGTQLAHDMDTFILVVLGLLFAAIFVSGIVQIVFGAKENNGVGLGAGINAVLIVLLVVAIPIVILNIIVLAKK